MEIPEIKSWLYIVNAASTAIIAVYLGFRRKHDKNAERITVLQESVARQKSQLEVFITRLEAVEKSNDRQTVALNQLLHDMGKLDGRMEGVGNSLDLLIQHQISESRK